MEKCNVCEKTTLFPTKFGATNVCKKCYIKAGGPMWHHCYDKYEDVQKHREKALESTKKQNFPDAVIEVIDQFFLDQVATMQPCVCCGETVQQIHKVGKADLCKSCFGKINTEAWRHADYLDNEEVENNRKKILKIANKKKFPQIAIDGINSHFDKNIQKGLIVAIDNHYGQILKVYETHSQLIIKNSFSKERIQERIKEVFEEYDKEHRAELPKGRMLLGAAVDVATKGVVRAGINLATTAASNKLAGDQSAEGQAKLLTSYLFPMGENIIDYTKYDSVECGTRKSDQVGFIRFLSNQKNGSNSGDRIFIYFYGDEKAQLAAQKISEGMTRAKTQQRMKEQQGAQLLAQSSIADELLKFKQLLDAGAITQEEYDAKKKQLLNL